MESPREWAQLQRAADHETIRRSVRATGIGSTVWGVINLAIGAGMGDVIVTMLGLALLGTGIWKWAKPSPGGLLASGITLSLIGAWNILGTVLSAAAGSGAGPFVVLGVLQVMWGVRYFQRWRRFSRAGDTPASEADVQQARVLLQALRESNPKQVGDVIEFTVGALNAQRGRVRLMDQGVVCLLGDGDDVRVVRRAQFDVQPNGGAVLGGARKVRVRLAERTLDAVMPVESINRYETWKGGAPAVAA